MSGTVTVAPATGYVRPKGATPALASLVVAYKPCTAPNRAHGGGLSGGSCNGPVPESTFLTVGTPDANTAAANMAGSIRADVKVGDPANMVDDADVLLKASLSDVRRKSDLMDYTGELQESLTLRITDRHNGPSLSDPATVVDTPFTFTVPCAGTSGDPGAGSNCTVDTTADAVLPGSVPEGKRAIWELQQVRMFDGGSDGVASTAGNTLFATEGVFTP
jgi:hypothetical protein